MTLPTPSYHPPALTGFSLHDASGVLLCELPGTLRIASAIGNDDPYEWDRPPGSSAWFPLGDGIGRERPQATLSGRVIYPDGDAAIGGTALIHQSLRRARTVQFRGRHFATLRSDLPGLCRVEWGERLHDLTLTLTLNLTAPLTPETLQEAQQR